MKYQTSIIDLIKSRVSRRDYQQKEIEKSTIKELWKIFNKPLVGPFGGKTYFLLVQLKNSDAKTQIKIGTYGMISGAQNFIIAKTDKTEEKTIDFGYAFEQVILKATELNLGTCWLGGKFRCSQFSENFQLNNNEYIPAISPIGFPKEKQSIKESFISWGIKSKKRKSWEELFFLDDFSTSISEKEAEEFSIPLEMVRLGPSAHNIQPWRIVKEKSNDIFHFFVQCSTTSDRPVIPKLKLLDMGIAMCHFDLTAKELKLKGGWLKKEPLILNKKKSQHYIVSWKAK